MTTKPVLTAVAAIMCMAGGSRAWAQQPPPPAPKKALTGSAGAGLSLTQGNSETLNLSATIDSVYDPKTRNVMKWTLLYLRGSQNATVNVNRLSAMFRDEKTISPRTFVFAQVDALHDTFKNIDYLIAPTAGVGFKALNTNRSQLFVDVGAGGAVEEDAGFASRSSGAIEMSEKLTHQLTETTTLKQSATSLLKMNQFDDGLYTFGAGVAAKLSQRLQLSVDLLDTFKNRPPDATKRNDVALVTSIVAKY
jgi:putative salt-induced outer membrane protein YdiY